MSEAQDGQRDSTMKEEERARELGWFSLKKRQGYCYRDIVSKDLSGVIEIVEPDSFERDTVVGEEAMDAGRYKGILMRNRKSYLSMGWSDTETGCQERL